MNREAKIEDLIKGVKKNILLSSYTTFGIGGPAKYFFTAKTKKDLINAIKAAKNTNTPFFILGGGSNLLVADEGFAGLVIKIRNTCLTARRTKYLPYGKADQIRNTKIITETGVLLSALVKESVKSGLTGLEWAAGIPGTVGGAIRGNAAAFEGLMSSVVKEVEVFDVGDLKVKILKNKDCQFDYKNSIFKQNPHLVILSAELQLKKGKKREIEKKIKEYLEYRQRNHPLDFASAGCIFQNPANFSAGSLIDKCGLKGEQIGQAQISQKHANFIVNLGDAQARDVKELINLIKEKVKEKFGIELKKEIQFLGF